MTTPACGTTCDGTCGWCRLTAERDALKVRLDHEQANAEQYAHISEQEKDALKAEVEKSSRDWNAVREAHDRRASEINDLKTEVARLNSRLEEAERSGVQDIDERDSAQDALSDTHIALGGDGEWVCRVPSPEPPDSGDLICDVPKLAEIVMDDAKRLREALERALPAFCASPCLHDDNYGSVKCHDMECAEIRRLLGQDIDEDGRIKDAASR